VSTAKSGFIMRQEARGHAGWHFHLLTPMAVLYSQRQRTWEVERLLPALPVQAHNWKFACLIDNSR